MAQLELANRFDGERRRLRSVAYRIVGSVSEADDAVQEAWLRLQRTDADEIDNLEAWLTTVVARICLNILRDRRSHPEEPLDAFVPEPIIESEAGDDPEHEVLLADAVGIALQVVIDALNPAERLAFVLHDMFGVPFDEIAPLVERSPAGDEAARQPRPPPDPRCRARAEPRPGPAASRRRRILRRVTRGRPRRPRRGARPGRGRALPRPHRRVRAARRRQGRARGDAGAHGMPRSSARRSSTALPAPWRSTETRRSRFSHSRSSATAR